MSVIPRPWPNSGLPSPEPQKLHRLLVFSLVGGFGILIQLATLAALTAGLRVRYLVATGLAVEAAVLHNFFWHECWTWADRVGCNRSSRWKRLWRFQVTNGVLSIGGNVALMRLLVGVGHLNCTLANFLSIVLCSLGNFLASDRLVFPGQPREGRQDFASLATLGERAGAFISRGGTGEGVKAVRPLSPMAKFRRSPLAEE
jgi:putative flippase GtrA